MTHFERVGVLGAGAMGAGIAEVAVRAGAAIRVFDVAEEALARGRAQIEASLASAAKRGLIESAAVASILERIEWTHALADLAGCDLAIEAVVERKDVKADLFAKLEAILAPEAVIATNTSSLSVTELAAGLARPERFLGLHFFNPAPVMKLVEVVSGADTAPEIAARAAEAMRAWGKTAAAARDVPGFIVNRVARPFYSEGWRAFEEGVAGAAEIDAAIRLCAGFRMGPLELGDLIGHDVNYSVACSMHEAYFGRGRFLPSLAQGALVAAGRLGRKTKRGVYDYAGEPAKPAFARSPALQGAPAIEAVFAQGAEFDDVLLAGGDGRSAALRAAEAGKPVALFDWAADPAKAEALAVYGSDARATEIGAGAAAAWGKEALVLADRPGGLVLRLLAQLANAAADALRDRVASAHDIDAAMRFGANYPFGPLAWADRAGPARVAAALDHIAHETGEAMYRPSEILRRAAIAPDRSLSKEPI